MPNSTKGDTLLVNQKASNIACEYGHVATQYMYGSFIPLLFKQVYRYLSEKYGVSKFPK